VGSAAVSAVNLVAMAEVSAANPGLGVASVAKLVLVADSVASLEDLAADSVANLGLVVHLTSVLAIGCVAIATAIISLAKRPARTANIRALREAHPSEAELEGLVAPGVVQAVT